jgi:hypothetical protein
VASVYNENGDDRQMVLHYLVEDSIVELSAPGKDIFNIGVVADSKELQTRIAELLQITAKLKATAKPKGGRAMLDGEAFQDLKAFSQKGQTDRAEALLESTKLSKTNKTSLLAAMGNPERGQIVVMRPGESGIEAGRRSSVFGNDGSAWLVRRLTSESQEVEISACDAARIGALLTELTDELSE